MTSEKQIDLTLIGEDESPLSKYLLSDRFNFLKTQIISFQDIDKTDLQKSVILLFDGSAHPKKTTAIINTFRLKKEFMHVAILVWFPDDKQSELKAFIHSRLDDILFDQFDPLLFKKYVLSFQKRMESINELEARNSSALSMLNQATRKINFAVYAPQPGDKAFFQMHLSERCNLSFIEEKETIDLSNFDILLSCDPEQIPDHDRRIILHDGEIEISGDKHIQRPCDPVHLLILYQSMMRNIYYRENIATALIGDHEGNTFVSDEVFDSYLAKRKENAEILSRLKIRVAPSSKEGLSKSDHVKLIQNVGTIIKQALDHSSLLHCCDELEVSLAIAGDSDIEINKKANRLIGILHYTDFILPDHPAPLQLEFQHYLDQV